MTPLKGIDGNVYAIAQGNLVVGGFDASGADGSRITVNVPSAGRIPGGATVERPVPSGFDQGNYLTLNLNRPDFTTAKNIVDQINDCLLYTSELRLKVWARLAVARGSWFDVWIRRSLTTPFCRLPLASTV